MATIVKDRVDDPSEADVERYVGLEHLDSESLTIRRWGSPSDVEATKLRFRNGDIIFGRRRVYQRKLAVAEFDGICSAHAMVLRAKPEVALPEFLPSFMQSDLFMERAKAISVGSLSPTINWKALAKEKFALPPLTEQRHAIAVFGALDDAIKAYSSLTDQLNDLLRAQLIILGDVLRTPMGDLAELVTKGTTPTTIDRDYVRNGVPFLRAEDVLDSEVNFASCHTFIDDSTHDALARSKIRRHDVLLTIAGTVGRVALVPETAVEANCNQAVAILRFAERARAQFIAAWLQSQDAQAQLLGSRVTGTISNLSLGKIKSLQVPLLAESDAETYCLQHRRLTSARADIHKRMRSLRSLRKLVLKPLESGTSDV
jgi:restriction endonuclease S subunit